MSAYHCQILERSCRLNVRQCPLQILQFPIHSALCLLCTLHSLHLKGLNCLKLPIDIVCCRLERLEMLLDLIHDSSVP